MKTTLTLLSVGLLAASQSIHAAGPTIPQRPPPDAFQKLTEDWPFALATPVVAAAEPVKGWASNYYVGGIMKNYESGKEEFVVAVKSRDGQAAFSLSGSQPNTDDISIGGIELSEKILDSRVTLKKGSEFATIKFDEAVNQVNVNPAQPNAPRPGMPNPLGVRQNGIRPPGSPGIQPPQVPRPVNLPQGMPQAAPVPLPVPGNTNPGNTNAAPMPGNSNVPPSGVVPNAPKQRVRVIKSTP